MNRLLLLLAPALAAAFLLLDPAHTITGSAALTALRAGGVAALTLLAAIGAGGAVLASTSRASLERAGGWLAALALGIAIQGALLGLFAMVGRFGIVAAGTVLVATGAGWIARPPVRLPRLPPLPLLVGLLFLAPVLIDALAPATDTDELSYQLAMPRRLLEGGQLLGGYLHPEGSRPMPVHLVFGALLGLGGEAAVRLWCVGIAVALAVGVRALAEERFGEGQGDLPALALVGSYSWLREAGVASNNHVVALWLLVAADAVLHRRFVLMGWFCGFALAAKYTAAPAVAGLALVAAWDGLRPEPRRVFLAAVATLLPLVPWWLRNVAADLHPLFPFAGWPDAADFVFMYREKYGMGHDALSTALLPWNVLMRSEIGTFGFLGRVSLLWAALALAALAGLRDGAIRRLAFIGALGFVGWAAGVQILRYLLPLLGIAALAGATLPRRWPALLLFLASLPANLAPALDHAAARAAVVTGQETEDSFLSRELPAWPALRYLRDHVPEDAPVAMLYAWYGYRVEQPWILGSVEDHIPTRYWIWQHGEGSLTALRDLGVRYLLVGDVHFLKKSYPFLTPEVLEEQFRKPEELLRKLLTRDATRLFAEEKWEVWRLDAPMPTTADPTRLDAAPPAP